MLTKDILHEKRQKEFSDANPAQRAVKGMTYQIFAVLGNHLCSLLLEAVPLSWSPLACPVLARGKNSLLQSQMCLESHFSSLLS